jgi:raffinose/stachyose/melibiose transport system substrate-binding protein
MNFLKKIILTVVTLSIAASLSITLTGCPSAPPVEEVEETTPEETTPTEGITPSDTEGILKIWHYEADNAMATSWEYAMEKFKAMYPNVTVEFELKTFEQMQETARMVLSSDDVPDVMECNKGSSTAGLYAMEGLLTDITDEAKARGWDEIMGDSFQTTCRYDDKGIMGLGNLYGVTTYGEFVMVYYNKNMFDKYNLEVPTTLEEFETIAETFVAEGIVPITIGGLDKWPLGHNWYEMVLYKADRDFINNYQLFQGEVDFKGADFTFGAEKFVEHVKKGYYDPNANGISYDDSNAAFVQGQVPMNITGSWMYGNFLNIKDFEWGIFLMPGKDFNTGSGGNLWVVPQNAKNKNLAYEYINLTLGRDAQTVMANAGGIPINVDLTQIQDKKVLELNEAFNTIVQNDSLAFYPDWPVPGYMDILGSSLQKLIAGTMSPTEFNDAISIHYNEYKSSME